MATVITNLISAIPYIGPDIVEWLWGGFSVGNPTLNRFFSLHYLLPFVLAGLAVLHLIALHIDGSSNPLGVESNIDKIPFHPYYSIKDLFGYALFAIFFSLFVFYAPNLLGHPDNYVEANNLVTPAHIQPEWYFLFAYAVLRSIPDKLLGVLALFGSLVVLFVIPHIHFSHVKSLQFRPISKVLYWAFVANFFLLTYIGAQPVEEPFILIGQLSSLFYFAYLLLINPLAGYLENRLFGINY